MASVKVKFRPSTIEGKEGTIYYQIIQNRGGCVKTLAQPFLMIYSPAIFPFVYAAFFSFIW